MPKRPISHRLESESVSAFQAATPKRWVTREKRPDYGVDLEVEIFDENDDATGIVFNVQLKASGSPKSARRPRLKLESLKYLNSLDVPTLIVSYCATHKKIYYRWHFEVAPNGLPEGRYIYVAMDDADEWDNLSTAKIEECLRIWKALKRHPSSKQVPLLVHMTPEADSRLSNGRMKLVTFLETVAGIRPTLTPSKDELQLSVFVGPDRITVAIPYLASLTIEVEESDEEENHAVILYALAYIFNRSGLPRHAELLALHCERHEIRGRSRWLAESMCCGLNSSAIRSANLAIINELHAGRDGLPIVIFHHLATTHFSSDDKEKAIDNFVKAAMLEDPDRADLRYSLGNHYAGKSRYAEAVRHFSAARRIEPAYCRRAYFLAELGASLYSAGRYGHAARCYHASVSLEDDQKTRLFLGDALLFSGKIEEAKLAFEAAATGSNRMLARQASLKGSVCRSLVSRYGVVVNRQKVPPELDLTHDLGVALRADPLDDLVNFNAGVSAAREGHHMAATHHFLIAAFARAGDEEAWTNALISSVNVAGVPLLESILFSALGMGGPKSIMSFRDRIASLGDAELLEILDKIIAEAESDRSHKAILRLHDEDGSFQTAYREL